MDVVLIAYHFPPDPAVGALRAAKVAHAFRDAGHSVHVVTARTPGETTPRLTDDPALIVHPVTLLPHPRQLFAWMKARLSSLRRRRQGGVARAGAVWTPPTQVAGWKRLLFSLDWLPDDRRGFILPAWWKARGFVRRGARLVYSTAPPYSPHLVGLALSAMKGTRWIMELRDPWADNDQKPWWVRHRATDMLDAYLERLCLERADLVVTVSEGIRRRLLTRLATTLDSSRVVVVRNGIDHLVRSVGAERRTGPVRIAYTGTFYYSRDPRPFLRGLAAVYRKHRMRPEQVRVDFIGACRSIGTFSVENEIDALGLNGVVHIQDWLPYEAAKAVMEEADVLLLLAQQQPDQVPNKLYEYLGTRRPILAFADASGETARMLRQVGGHHVITGDDEEEAERALERLLVSGSRGNGIRTDETVLKEWTTEVQMKRLLVAVQGQKA
jgi:glycosyl transferase family 4